MKNVLMKNHEDQHLSTARMFVDEQLTVLSDGCKYSEECKNKFDSFKIPFSKKKKVIINVLKLELFKI